VDRLKTLHMAQEKYAAHEQAMLGDPEKRKLWDEYASRPEAVAEMPSGLFGTGKNAIPEERTVGNRRSNLLGKKQWTPDHQAFHDFYYGQAQVRLQEGVARQTQRTLAHRMTIRKSSMLDTITLCFSVNGTQYLKSVRKGVDTQFRGKAKPALPSGDVCRWVDI
jgi:hypothetical protein